MRLRLALLACLLALSACNASGDVRSFSASEVQPGLASCLDAIDRPDVAADPDAPMSVTEISALVTCTAERAGG